MDNNYRDVTIPKELLDKHNIELTGELRIPVPGELYIALNSDGIIHDCFTCTTNNETMKSINNGKRYICRKKIVARDYTFDMKPTREELDAALYRTNNFDMEFAGKNLELTGEYVVPQANELFVDSMGGKAIINRNTWGIIFKVWTLRKKNTIAPAPTIDKEKLSEALKIIINDPEVLEGFIYALSEQYTKLLNSK